MGDQIEEGRWYVRIVWGRFAFSDFTGHEPGWETRSQAFDDTEAAMDYARDTFEFHRARANPRQFIVDMYLIGAGGQSHLPPAELLRSTS